jgi:4-diphosphocytidyl-2-C-methyl-D-erythritol kinase
MPRAGAEGAGGDHVEEGGLVAPRSVQVRVPSKVNLFLSVRGLRDDGYHELVSIMQTVSIYDTVTASIDGEHVASLHPAARRFVCLDYTQRAGEGVPEGDDNLAVRAARRLMAAVGLGSQQPPDPHPTSITRLHLDKSIPIAAGMAGGSADAAAALLALNRLWAVELDRDELREMAGELGSDVPFCVLGGTALATGTGTATAQVLTRGTYHWVVGISDRSLSTPEVYAAHDHVGVSSDVEPDAVLQALRTGDAEALGVALHNDLEVAAFHLRPELEHARDAMLDAGALGAVVSGSGPTLVALAESSQHAAELAAAVRGHFDRVEVASSPAGGPEIVIEPR